MAGFESLLYEVRSCTLCSEHLPLGPRPVLQLHPDAKILVAGQKHPDKKSMNPVCRFQTPAVIGLGIGWAWTEKVSMIHNKSPFCRWVFAFPALANRVIFHQDRNAPPNGVGICWVYCQT